MVMAVPGHRMEFGAGQMSRRDRFVCWNGGDQICPLPNLNSAHKWNIMKLYVCIYIYIFIYVYIYIYIYVYIYICYTDLYNSERWCQWCPIQSVTGRLTITLTATEPICSHKTLRKPTDSCPYHIFAGSVVPVRHTFPDVLRPMVRGWRLLPHVGLLVARSWPGLGEHPTSWSTVVDIRNTCPLMWGCYKLRARNWDDPLRVSNLKSEEQSEVHMPRGVRWEWTVLLHSQLRCQGQLDQHSGEPGSRWYGTCWNWGKHHGYLFWFFGVSRCRSNQLVSLTASNCAVITGDAARKTPGDVRRAGTKLRLFAGPELLQLHLEWSVAGLRL